MDKVIKLKPQLEEVKRLSFYKLDRCLLETNKSSMIY